MKNYIPLVAALFFICLQAKSQQQKFDRKAQLKSCLVNVKSDNFTATTFIELEFYNPGDTEIEGLYVFDLKQGQVITGFQLMLNGQYRDGSIEEKWKATNTYNAIVGKRVDPGLLKLMYNNTYSLNVYPIPPKSSRKVTITINEILPVVQNELQYILPFGMTDTCGYFAVDMSVRQPATSTIKTDNLLKWVRFQKSPLGQELKFRFGKLLLNAPLSYSIPLQAVDIVGCAGSPTKKYFALRHHTTCAASYDINPSTLAVYWDISGSLSDKDFKREINFLQQLLDFHQVKTLTIIPFNDKLRDTATFDINSSSKDWKNYINHLQYDGATQFGCINLTNNQADMVMIFSDERNTFGKRLPVLANRLVYSVNNLPPNDERPLQKMIELSGGKRINLSAGNIYDALYVTAKAENKLMTIRSASKHVVFDQTMPGAIAEHFFISGTTIQQHDTLFMSFGNYNRIQQVDTIVLDLRNCDQSLTDKITMLNKFPTTSVSKNWEAILEFGLQEKVVTSNTAFIVLEQASDYVKYNITPPKDLQAECDQMNYVKKETRWERHRLKKSNDYERLEQVVTAYNEDNKKRHPDAVLLNFNKASFDKANLHFAAPEINSNVQQELIGKVSGVMVIDPENQSLNDVVVIGYSAPSNRQLTGSVTHIRNNQLLPSGTLEQSLQGRVAGLEVTNAFGAPGSVGNISIRGAGSLSGNNQPLYVLDGMPVTGDINGLVNINEINDVTVLKDASSTALYGSRGSNGVIVVNRKKATLNSYPDYNSTYKLSDRDDVDYMAEWYAADADRKIDLYKSLQKNHPAAPGFYFDMAQAFYKIGDETLAMDILMTANEVSNGHVASAIASAYILESWNKFDEAAFIYEQLLEDNPQQLSIRRNLAWAYYRQGKYQLAVNTLFAALQSDPGFTEAYDLPMKVSMLKEMNAIISMHKNLIDTSGIPEGMLQTVTADLRIVLDCSIGALYGVSIREPGGKEIKAGDNFFTSAYYSKNFVDYQADIAKHGHYKIRTSFYDYGYSRYGPCYVRITAFKNFGKPTQSITIENVVLDNQSGNIEISELKVD